MSKVKFLTTLALVAFCVALASGASFAADSWAVADSDLPSGMLWDELYEGSVEAENDGTETWDDTYYLASVAGTSIAADLIDRWGVTTASIATDVEVEPEGTVAFDLAIVAPPISGTFQCAWMMADGTDTLLETALAESDVTIRRFAESVPGREGEWAADWIEACAGRVPFIVQGFTTTMYGPTFVVDRAQLAKYIVNAMDIPEVEPEEDTFPDVGSGYWAYGAIEALAELEIVGGYGDGSYQPEWPVIRGQMAEFIVRGAGLDVPDVEEDVFPDVTTTYPHAAAIAALVDAEIVSGYDDGLYRPGLSVDRAQMAVYCARAFIESTAVPVVLGGPGLTDVDPDAVDYHGWSTVLEDPGFAYVEFAAARLDGTLAGGGTWDVTFDFRDAATPTVTGTEVTETFDAATLDAIDAEADEYFTVSTAVPALGAGDYVLAVLVMDKNGAMRELARTVEFTIPEP